MRCYPTQINSTFAGATHLLSRFHTLAASSDYLEAQYELYQRKPDDLPADWRAAFDLIAAYFPDVGLHDSLKQASAATLIRRSAHLTAQLDPLGRVPTERWNSLGMQVDRRLSTLRGQRENSVLNRLLQLYGGPLALETGHLDDVTRVEWIETRREGTTLPPPTTRRRALEAVIKAETFEALMGARYPSKKRFGAEGAESLHALIQRILDRAAAAGVAEVVIGTMHRGRLGLMACLWGQSPAQLFSRVVGEYPSAAPGRAADVPYHLGLLTTYHSPAGIIRVRLLPNPSHLEAINAVVLGFARHRQEVLGSAARVLPLILHTDASVVAQGVVGEALQLSAVAGHQVGGALHVIVNNQLGFTTEPDEGRSSRHCTAPWKAVDSLIVHVNGDDVDAVLAAADLAFEYRESWAAESVVDLVCVRSNGHNELDEPRFTQPTYYELVNVRKPISERYATLLSSEDIVHPDFRKQVMDAYRAELDTMTGNSEPLATGELPAVKPALEALPLELIAELAGRIPSQGEFGAKAVRLVKRRHEEWQTKISWPTAEILAFGAALASGWDVRLTGQDVERGAFSQRHLALVDVVSGARRRVFEDCPTGWGNLGVYNSPLCEYAALAFEYGYSVAADKALNIWEAQFGDFANGAQIVLDQFICSGAEKWDQLSGLVIVLPHGLEGQGPEHSSGRIERMLQLAAKDNLRIAHPSTPANYFHLLVSQIYEVPRKPLIIFSPKKLLRLKAAVSPSEEFKSGGFQPIIVSQSKRQTRRFILCSGKIFYELAEALAISGRDDVTMVRLEQLYPFPEGDIAGAIISAPNAEIVWVQEEPANFGAWTWLLPQLNVLMQRCGAVRPLTKISRRESPSPAGSFHADHDGDQARLVEAAIGNSDRGF
jgi:2-oxoglutarate dehydrogenase E1 component